MGDFDKGTKINKPEADNTIHPLDLLKKRVDAGEDFSYLAGAADNVALPGYTTKEAMNDFGQSMYDKSLTEQYFKNYGDDKVGYQYQRGEEQGSLAKLGSGVANAVTTGGLDIVKDASYLLDITNYTDFKKSSEEGFHNWLGDAIQGMEDNLKLPVYRTKASEGFSPASAGWWGDNIPSLASSLSMIIPAEGAIKGFSMLGKLMGGEKIIQSMEAASGVVGLADKARGVGAAIVSRHMESLMEGGQTFEDTFNEAKKAGKSDDDAKRIAGEAAAENYKLNWAAIIQDIPEYMILHKTFKESNSLFSIAAAKEAGKTALLEGSEEAYQYITDKESKRSALINGKILKDDNSSIADRLVDYAKDGDLWTSAFFGAIGGAAFGAVGIHNDSKNQVKFDALLEAHKAILKGDPETYYRAQDNLLNTNIAESISDGNLDNFKSGLNHILSNPERIKDEDRGEINRRINDAIKQTEYAEDISKDIINDQTLSPELKKLSFTTKLNQRSIENRLSEINSKVNTYRAKDASIGLQPDIQAYKEAKLTLEAIKDIPLLATKAKELQSNIDATTEDLLKAYPTKYKTAEDLDKAIISSHDPELKKLLGNKALEESNLSDIKDLSFTLKSDLGKKILNEKIQEKKQKAVKYNEINDAVDKAETEKDLDNAYKQADKNDVSTPQLVDKIAKKRQDIKAKVAAEQVVATNANAVNPTDNPAPVENVPDMVDEATVNTPSPIDDESKRPTNVNKTNNGIDDDTKEAETRAYRYHEKMVLDGQKLQVVTRNNNPELFNAILEQDPTGKQFEEDFYSGKAEKHNYLNNKVTKDKYYNGIYTVLVDKNNKIILADQNGNVSANGKMVFHTLESANRIESDSIIVSDKDKSISEIAALRGNLLKVTNPNTYLSITEKSKGLPQFLPAENKFEFDENGDQVDTKVRPRISVTESFGPIESIKVELPTLQATSRKGSALLSNGQIAFTGKLYAFDKSNTAFDLIPRNVSESEADMIIDLIDQRLGLKPRTTSAPVTQIEKIVSALIPKAGPNKYTFGFKGEELYVGKDLIVNKESFAKPEVKAQVRQFLISNKYVNANTNKKNGYALEDKFIAPTLDDKQPGKTYNSYKEYLLSGENPMFGTDLAPKTQVQYRQVYLKYDPNILTDIIGNTTPISDSNGDMEVTAEHDFDDEPKVPTTSAVVSKSRNFYEDTNDDNESLDRSVERIHGKDVYKLTDDEKTWFYDNFPKIPVETVKGLIEGEALGRFLSSGKVLLSDIAPNGTLYHEAFHVTTQLYLSKKEIDALYKEARERTNNSDAEDRSIEELLAEDFADYKETGKILKESPKRNSLFRKLLDFVKRMVGLPASSIEEIYKRLDKGYYTGRKMRNVRQFSQLDSTVPGLSVTETKELMSGMDAMFFDIVFKDNKTPAEALSKVDKVLQFIYKRLVAKEKEVVASGNEELIKTYDNIFNNWPSVMDEWTDRMKSLGIDIAKSEVNVDLVPVDDEENKVEDTGERSGSAFTESNQVSTKSTMFNSTKMLIRSLKQKDSNRSDVLNSLGLPQTVEFGSSYNYLLKQLVGLTEYPDIYNKIKELSNSRPEYKDLLDRIKEPSINLTPEQMFFQRQFRQDFSKNMSTSFVSVLQADGTILQVDSNKQNIQDKTKERWKSRLKTLSKVNSEGRYIVDPLATKDDVAYLKSIGIYFSNETLGYTKDNKEFKDAATAIRNYVKANNNDLTDLYSTDSGVAGNLNTLLALESEYNVSATELSVISTEGKTIYPIGLNNGLSIVKNLINNSESLEDLYIKLPHLNTVNAEGSVWLSAMFDENGKRRKDYRIELNLADGLKTDTSIKKNAVANSTRKLGTADKFVQEIDHLLKFGNSSVVRTADKGTEHIIGLNKFNGKKLIVPIEDLKTDPSSPDITGFNNENIKSIFRGYFKSELRRIAMFELYGVGANIDEYAKSGNKWTIFSSFPFSKPWKKTAETEIENLKARVKAETITQDEVDQALDNLAKDLQSQVDVSTTEFLEDYSTELKRKLEEYKVLGKSVEFGGITAEAVARGFSKELLAQYPVDQLVRAVVVNDFINSVEQMKLFFGDMAFYKALFKRTSSLAGTKETCSVDPILNEWLNTNNKRLDGKTADGTINVAIFEDSTQSKQDLGEYKKALMKSGFTESEASKLLNAYTKMDEGDAQGWITMDEYREFMIRLGSWSTAVEKVWEKAQRGELLSKDEMKYFIVKKAQYAGPIVNDKLFIPGFHKFSLMPLLPQLVKGRNMSKVLANMTKQQVGYGLFKSGSKVGTPLQNGKANSFYTEVNHGDINESNYNIQKVDYRFLGLQVKSSEPHDTVTYGTQFRKLLFTGAFEGGEERIPGAKKLFDEYTETIKGQVEEAKAKLIKELGLDPNDGYKAKDVTKLVALLRAESKSRSHADNIIDALQTSIDEAGNINLKYPLDAMVNKSKIDAMMMSLINARLVRQKVNGDAYIQGASTGFETIGKREIGTNRTLKFYEQTENGTSKAEVMVPLSKQYYSLLEKYGSIEAVNEAIAAKDIDERILTLIGYRIPTQGLNSIDHLIIKQFLPEESGQLIILPTEIVAKSGGDYDIDKLNIFRPDINKDGSYKESKHNDIIRIASSMLSNPMNFNALITPNSTSILTDKVEENTYNAYKTKEGITNSGEEEEKERELFFKNQNKKTDYTRQLMMTEKVENQHSKLMLAKDMIGIGAVNNVFIPLAQSIKATLNTSYKDSSGKTKKVKINFPHNLVKEGENEYIDLSRSKDKLGINDIQEVNSQIINATVDAANSPGLLASLGMNVDTLSVYLYLNDVGVPFDYSFYMMKQPVMQRYIKEFSINNSGFLSAIGAKETTQELRERISDEFADKITTPLGNIDYSLDNLKKYAVYDNTKDKTPESDNEFYNLQFRIFNDFLDYKEQAQLLSEGIRSVNHDTAGLPANLEAVHLKLESIAKVKQDNFVQGLDKILTQTPIGVFDQNQFAVDAYSQFYATQSPQIVRGMGELMKFIGPFKSSDKTRLATLITNDFINYVTQNYGYDNITDTYNKLFKGESSVAKRILRIQSAPGLSNKELANNLLIKELQPIIANDKTADLIDNVRLYTKRFDTFTANQLTEAFRELKDLDTELYKDIMDLGIIQSGLANSAITYVGIIPFEYFGDLFNKAFDNYNKKNGASDFAKFQYLFLANNTKDNLIYPKAKKLFVQPKGNAQFGKNYALDENTQALDIASQQSIDNESIIEEDEDDSTKEQTEGKTETEEGDPDVQFSKRDGDITKKLKDSGYISQHNGELYIKQNFFVQASNLISSINKETPGLLTKKMLNHFGKAGRQIWKVEVNDQLGLQFNNQGISDNKDNLIREKYFSESNKIKSEEILQKISESKHVLAKLANKLIPYARANNVDVILDNVEGFDNSTNNTAMGANGYYSPKANEIHIAEKSNYNADGVESVIIHEIIHSITQSKLRDNSSVSKDFEKIYEYAIDKLDKSRFYGLSNKDEFIVALFTDPTLIKELQTIPASKYIKKYKNLFQEIFDFILGILRIGRTNSLYEQAFSTASNVVQDFKDSNDALKDSVYEDTLYSKAPSPYAKQEEYIKNKVFRMEKALKRLTPGSEEFNEALFDLAAARNSMDTALKYGEEAEYLEIGKDALKSVQEIVDQLKAADEPKANDILDAKNIISAWKDFQGLKDEATRLEREIYPFINNLTIERANEYSTRPEVITQAMIDAQNRDIGKFERSVGALADSGNIIASTIGSMISAAHNRVSTENKQINSKIQDEIDELVKYTKKAGIRIDNMYDLFIQEHNNTTVLTKEFLSDGSENPNYMKIKATPELDRFYKFYQKTMRDIQQGVPSKGLGIYFIPNIKERGIAEKLKDLSPLKERSTKFTKSEDVRADVVPLKMNKPIPADVKTKNLGYALSRFAMFANNYTEMSKILPEVRLLQEEIKYTRDFKTGIITDRQYIKPSSPTVSVAGEHSNLNKMVQTVIDMQVKGEMKNEEWKPGYKDILDENGNKVGEKYTDISGTIDNMLAYNSMLRIGLSPITAISNVTFGDVSNVIEAVGGRFMTAKGLIQASNIFMVQTWDEHSVLNKLLERLNPLQEMDDYEYVEDIKSAGKQTKMSADRLKEYMYLPQKKGEKWLQSRTMLAVMIKEGLLTSDGKLTEKYNKLSDAEIEQLSTKIQRLNQLIHGRYTAKEAATLQQSVLYRTFIQFRKWIPAAIENRIGESKWDNRLQADMEGRYRTWGRMIVNLKDTIKRIKEGKLTELEVYNIKKGLMELATWAMIGLAYSMMHGDDDKDKKFRKQTWVKTTLTLLSRTAGDIQFFYSPRSATQLVMNTAPLAKTADDMLKLILVIPTAFGANRTILGTKTKAEITKGRKKHQSKFRAQLPKLVIGANPVNQVLDLASDDELPNN